jgi:hypothetical protein
MGTTNEEQSNTNITTTTNNKFFKNKMTAALNHMKYRMLKYFSIY